MMRAHSGLHKGLSSQVGSLRAMHINTPSTLLNYFNGLWATHRHTLCVVLYADLVGQSSSGNGNVRLNARRHFDSTSAQAKVRRETADRCPDVVCRAREDREQLTDGLFRWAPASCSRGGFLL